MNDNSNTAMVTTEQRDELIPAFVMTITQARTQLAQLREFVKEVMVKDEDYGAIPGTDKPTLLKPGAEKLNEIYGYAPVTEVTHRVEDWENGFFHYECRTRLVSKRTGSIIAEGIGSCNSRESKYAGRWAWGNEVPSHLDKSRLKKKEFNKKDGSGTVAKYLIPNDDIYSIVNTLLKMASKRCLGGTVPLLFRTSEGVSRNDVETLWQIYLNDNEELYLPGPDGTWRRVLAMSREENRPMLRVTLGDGSYIRCTPEHRFPTSAGLLSAAELQPGISLLRSPISLDRTTGALEDYGWATGLFIAEGSYHPAVIFTLSGDEEALATRIHKIASTLGCPATIFHRPDSNTIDVRAFGPAFGGMIRQFVAGEGSDKKHLRNYAWRQGSGFLQSLLDGYLTGDAHLHERTKTPQWNLGFTGANWELAYDLRSICAVLGHRINLMRRNARYKDVEYPIWHGWIKVPADTYNNKNLEAVVSVEPEDRTAPAYDIQIDGDHLFCLANGIVSHNSLIDATLRATRSSGLFTQDMEDLQDTHIIDAKPERPPQRPPERKATPRQPEQPSHIIDEEPMPVADISQEFEADTVERDLIKLKDKITDEHERQGLTGGRWANYILEHMGKPGKALNLEELKRLLLNLECDAIKKQLKLSDADWERVVDAALGADVRPPADEQTVEQWSKIKSCLVDLAAEKGVRV